MSDTTLLGQGDELDELLAGARALRLPHAILIEGAPGCGKTTLARQLIFALLDDGTRSDALVKQIQADTHPDVHWLRVPEGKQDIPIDAVRELQSQLALAAFTARARVAIVDPAERLNAQGQNALLKTLEEPGANSFLLLPTARPEAMLPTVRSRVARYRLRELSPELIARTLVAAHPGEDPTRLRRLADLADGSLGVAQQLVDQAELIEIHARLQQALQHGVEDPHGLLAECISGVKGREDVDQRARLVLRMLRLELRAHLRRAVAPDGGGAYVAPALDGWIASCERVFDSESDLNLHVGADQILAGLFLSWSARSA